MVWTTVICMAVGPHPGPLPLRREREEFVHGGNGGAGYHQRLVFEDVFWRRVGLFLGFVEEGVDGVEETLDAFEVWSPVVLLGERAGEGVAGGIEVAGGDGTGAEDDFCGFVGNAGRELEADDGIELHPLLSFSGSCGGSAAPTSTASAATPTTSPTGATPTTGSFSLPACYVAGQDRCNCSNFTAHAWAQWFHDTYDPTDVNRLDADHDGVVCESLP